VNDGFADKMNYLHKQVQGEHFIGGHQKLYTQAQNTKKYRFTSEHIRLYFLLLKEMGKTDSP
jgi:hypothetical protein